MQVMPGVWSAVTRWVTSPIPSTVSPEYIRKIRPSVALPTGTAIGQSKHFRVFAPPQSFGALHCYAANRPFTQELLDLTSNPLHTDSLRDSNVHTGLST